MTGFFKKLRERVTKPNVRVSVFLDGDRVGRGEELKGTLHIASEEEFDADEVRIEVRCIEEAERMVMTEDGWERRRERRVIWSTHVRVSGPLHLTPGYEQEFPFRVRIPFGCPTSRFEPDRRIEWSIKGVVAVKKRPDATSERIPIEVTEPTLTPTPTVTPAAVPTVKAEARPVQPPPTNCPRCGAPLTISMEDVIITCRYCGNTIVVATREEIKKHSMLENRLQPQQVVEIAKDYMDRGILRRGVSEKAQITGVKLRYVPFWVFPTYAETYYSGQRGTGVSELREIKHAVTDKRESVWGKLGKIVKAATELAVESYIAKEGGPEVRVVSERISRHYNWTTLARRAILSDIDYYEVPLERKIPFDAGRIPEDAEFFNTELTEDEAKVRVKAEVEIKQRELVEEEVDTIQQCYTNVRIGEGELIHAPVWFVHYRLGKEDYAIAVDGSTGKVLGGGRPLIKLI